MLSGSIGEPEVMKVLGAQTGLLRGGRSPNVPGHGTKKHKETLSNVLVAERYRLRRDSMRLESTGVETKKVNITHANLK